MYVLYLFRKKAFKGNVIKSEIVIFAESLEITLTIQGSFNNKILHLE